MKTGSIIAIIRDVDPLEIVEIAKVLLENEINALEVSLSNESKGLASIQVLNESFGGKIHLGVGTVVHKYQVDKALEAGAKYIITPGWDRELVRYIKGKNVDVYPGVFTPGDIMQAISEGVEVVKLFPASSLGIDYIKSLRGPFPNIRIMAVGGVNQKNIIDYYHAGCTLFAIGSDLVPRGATRDKIESIAKTASDYVSLLKKEGFNYE